MMGIVTRLMMGRAFSPGSVGGHSSLVGRGDRSGLQPFWVGGSFFSWGGAPGWYGARRWRWGEGGGGCWVLGVGGLGANVEGGKG
jgi:hypothetical protein